MAGEVTSVDTNNVVFVAYDKLFARIKPEYIPQNTAETVPIAPTEIQRPVETQYALDKILKAAEEKSKKQVVQADLSDLLNEASMTEPQPVAEDFQPEVLPPKIKNVDAKAELAELTELVSVPFDNPAETPKQVKKTASVPQKTVKKTTPKTEQAPTKAVVQKSSEKTSQNAAKNIENKAAQTPVKTVAKKSPQKTTKLVAQKTAQTPLKKAVKNAPKKTAKKPVKKIVAEKPAKKEENVSLLNDLLAETKADKNVAPQEKVVNKFDDRADNAVRGFGDAIISPFKALSGIKDVVTGDFDAGQKKLRNAAADLVNAPAQAVNLATTFVGVAVDDFVGETAEKVVTAPAKAVSGIWEAGVASVKPEEGSVKKAFDKMTFGIFN